MDAEHATEEKGTFRSFSLCFCRASAVCASVSASSLKLEQTSSSISATASVISVSRDLKFPDHKVLRSTDAFFLAKAFFILYEI